MSQKFSDLPDGNADQSAVMAGYQNPSQSVKLTVREHAFKGLATPAEMRAGAETTKGVSPRIVYNWVSDIFADTRHAWADWNPLTVVSGSGVGQGYGSVLVTGLRVGSATNLLSPSALGTPATGTIYNDAALVYNNGFDPNITQPSVADDSVQLMFWARSVGGGWILMVRFRFAGIKLYNSPAGTYPVFTEIATDSDLLVHNARGVSEGQGWRFTAAGSLEVPEESAGDSDFNNVPFAVKRQGSVLYAISLGYQDSQNRIYRVGTSTRDYRGSASAVGDPGYLVFNQGDIPTSPTADTIITIGANFGTYAKGERYNYVSGAWAKLPYDLDEATGTIDRRRISSGSAVAGTVLTSNGSGNAPSWQASADTGASRHYLVSSANVVGSDQWRVNDILENISETEITLTRGTQSDANGLMTRKSLYRITEYETNKLRIALLRRHGSMISGQQSIGINKIDPDTSADGKIAQVKTTGNPAKKQVVLDDLPNNSVGYNQINDLSKGANRIIHYNAAGTGITSSPHTDFEINANQIDGRLSIGNIGSGNAAGDMVASVVADTTSGTFNSLGIVAFVPPGVHNWLVYAANPTISSTSWSTKNYDFSRFTIDQDFFVIGSQSTSLVELRPITVSRAVWANSTRSSPISLYDIHGTKVAEVATAGSASSFDARQAGTTITITPIIYGGTYGEFDQDSIPVLNGDTKIANASITASTKIKPGTITSSLLSADIASGIGEAADLNDLWHSPGVYSVRPNTPNSPDHGDQGVLIANVNNQTFITNGLRGGLRKNRHRTVAITGQGTPSALTTESDVTFTRITDMLTNLNNIAPAAGTKLYYYWHADARGTGNVAGTDRPVNSPGYGGVSSSTLSSVTRQDRTAFGEFHTNYQIVCTGGSYTFNVSDNKVFYRTRSSASDSWPNNWTQILYHANSTPGAGQASVTALSALHQYGFDMIRTLNHLPGDSATTHEYYWFFPLSDVTNHPNGNTSSESPFLTRYVSVSGSTELRCIYNIGVDSGTGTNTYPRAESVTYSLTATSWADVDTSYDASNNRLTIPGGTQVNLVSVTETS